MDKEHFLLVCVAAVVLTACGTLEVRMEATTAPATLAMDAPPRDEMPTPAPPATFTPEAPFSDQTTIHPATSMPFHTPSADSFPGWKIFNAFGYSLKYPPSLYLSDSAGPEYSITDSKTTYDSTIESTPTHDELEIIFVALVLDRRLDPDHNPGLLASPAEALQREINGVYGIPYLVDGSTDVPWTNGNGGTEDGRKWFYPTIPYQDVMLGNAKAAKVVSEREIGYFILNPNDDSYYVDLRVRPANSTLMKVADQILSTFEFTN